MIDSLINTPEQSPLWHFLRYWFMPRGEPSDLAMTVFLLVNIVIDIAFVIYGSIKKLATEKLVAIGSVLIVITMIIGIHWIMLMPLPTALALALVATLAYQGYMGILFSIPELLRNRIGNKKSKPGKKPE